MAHGMGVLALTDLRLVISGVCLLAMSYAFTRGQLVAFFKEKKNYTQDYALCVYRALHEPVYLP